MTPCFVSFSSRPCVYFSVENSFSKVSWRNFLDAEGGNRAGFYGMVSPRKKKTKKNCNIQKNNVNIYDMPVLLLVILVIAQRIVIIIKHIIIKCAP